jgi:hypothetical protein
LTTTIAIRVAVLIAAGILLAGCGASNTSNYLGDNIPHWMGGLPPDAPPRPDDPRYADYYRAQLAAREQADLERARADEQEARIKAADGDFDHLTRAQTVQSARRQLPKQPAGQGVAQQPAAAPLSKDASALY